jgi:hypothetical protein
MVLPFCWWAAPELMRRDPNDRLGRDWLCRRLILQLSLRLARTQARTSKDTILMEAMQKPPHGEISASIPLVRPAWSRPLGVAFGAGFLAVLVIWIWGLPNLNGLPDVGDPFDVAAGRRQIFINDSDNAYVLYAQAKGKQSKFTAALSRLDLTTLVWSKAGGEIRDYLAKNREALDLWRAGSERPDALYYQPGKEAIDTLLPLVQDTMMLSHLGGLEGSRHQDQGDMVEAWDWYRAILRSSRHVGKHGVTIERLMGASMHRHAARRILNWAADPRVDARLLHKALDDTLAADAMTRPLSEALKVEYLMWLRDLDELRVTVNDVPMPGGRFGMLEQMVKATGAKPQIQRVRLRATNDVERSRRVMRLLFANWLAQVDKPASTRASIAIAGPTLIYAADLTAPPAARAVAPEILDHAILNTDLAQEMFRPSYPHFSTDGSRVPWEGDGPLAREPRRRADLIVKLAAELYRRERGQAPKTAGSLLDSYLKVLPEGIEPNDPIPTVER